MTDTDRLRSLWKDTMHGEVASGAADELDALRADNAALRATIARVAGVAVNCDIVAASGIHPHGARYVIACTEAAAAIRTALAEPRP